MDRGPPPGTFPDGRSSTSVLLTKEFSAPHHLGERPLDLSLLLKESKIQNRGPQNAACQCLNYYLKVRIFPCSPQIYSMSESSLLERFFFFLITKAFQYSTEHIAGVQKSFKK